MKISQQGLGLPKQISFEAMTVISTYSNLEQRRLRQINKYFFYKVVVPLLEKNNNFFFISKKPISLKSVSHPLVH
jgi:hypothetical protein